MAKEATKEAVKNLRADARQLAIEAERLLRHYAVLDKGNTAYKIIFDPGDAFVLRSAGFDVDNVLAMRKEFGRIEVEQELSERAGSPEAFDAAKAEAEKTAAEAKRLAKELGPKIEAMQRELQAAQLAERTAVGKRDSMAEARSRLRDYLPPFVDAIVGYEMQRARLSMEGKQRCDAESKCSKIVDGFVDAATAGVDWVERLELVG